MGKKNHQKKKEKARAKAALLSGEQEKVVASVASNRDEKEEQKEHSIDKLLDKAEQLIDEFNFELAQKFCQRALETEPDNVRALETSASLLMEIGDVENAKHCLGRAVEVCPDSGFSKYMTLGQLMDGAMAVQCYQKGIELMVKEKEEKAAKEVAAACSKDPSVTDRDISSAYCAIAEIYLTDCCFDDGAEEKCKEFADKAVEADPDNPEAWQTKANFLLSKDEQEEAKLAIKKSVSLWLPQLQALDEAGNSVGENFDPVEVCSVPFTARVQSGKMLIELEEYEEATDVLETLLDEDDEIPDVWYLLGWANYLHGKDYYSNSRHYLQKAKEVYKKVKHEDVEMLGHIDELLQELGPDDESENGTDMNLDIASSDEEDMMQ